ncbi:MAG: NYN domain-containing protein [Synechococcales cyanobacterium RM1_1_8]|nr:NYN domain-containing protein [Synechococcales cyanobacterium RM1_1_8]
MTKTVSGKASQPPFSPGESTQLQPRPAWLSAPGGQGQHPQLSASALSPVRGRVAVFIDGLSLFLSAKQLGIEIDYQQLLRYLSRRGQLLHAFFYAGIDQELDSSRQQGFLTWMRHHGYRVVTKTVQHFPDGNRKLDIDVEIAVDMMKLAPSCDTMVLVSGNDTLTYAVRRVGERGVRVELLALNGFTGPALLNWVDDYTDLTSIQAEISLGHRG